jgi:hypothetical protein
MAKAIENAIASAFSGAENAVAEFVGRGKLDVLDLVTSIGAFGIGRTPQLFRASPRPASQRAIPRITSETTICMKASAESAWNWPLWCRS